VAERILRAPELPEAMKKKTTTTLLLLSGPFSRRLKEKSRRGERGKRKTMLLTPKKKKKNPFLGSKVCPRNFPPSEGGVSVIGPSDRQKPTPGGLALRERSSD